VVHAIEERYSASGAGAIQDFVRWLKGAAKSEESARSAD
jgi:hypothetical protein